MGLFQSLDLYLDVVPSSIISSSDEISTKVGSQGPVSAEISAISDQGSPHDCFFGDRSLS
jgi:hypothetical protein